MGRLEAISSQSVVEHLDKTTTLGPLKQASFGYDSSGRLDTVTHTHALAWDYSHRGDGLRESITPLDPATGLPLATLPGWAYAYDDRGELTGASRHNAGTPVDNQARGYAFDDIGNRLVASRGAGAGARSRGYSPNSLNQYDSISHPRFLEITGEADPAATVSVTMDGGSTVPVNRALPEHQTGDPGGFRYEGSLTSAGARMAHVRIEAVKDGATHVQEGWLYAPPATETLHHDDDGNLTSDARWTYTWDAENRLVAMEERDSVTRPTGAPPRKRVRFAYDYRHRRVAKEVREWSASDGAFSRLVKSRRYVYDGWNMIAELDTTDSPSTGLQQARVVSTYVWGPDLAGQQGSVFAPESLATAGGVGGLLAVNHQGTTYYPCMDANGNIMGLVDATTGTLTARYDYDPFGARITDTGPTGSNGERIELCPFGFSTKYTDSETGLVYYGFRY